MRKIEAQSSNMLPTVTELLSSRNKIETQDCFMLKLVLFPVCLDPWGMNQGLACELRAEWQWKVFWSQHPPGDNGHWQERGLSFHAVPPWQTAEKEEWSESEQKSQVNFTAVCITQEVPGQPPILTLALQSLSESHILSSMAQLQLLTLHKVVHDKRQYLFCMYHYLTMY
jgi:hypothetical protein